MTIASQYRTMIPVALELLTDALDDALNRLTFGNGGDLDSLMNDTVSKTKLIAIFLPYAMQEAGQRAGIKYNFVNANGYDVEMDDNGIVKIEEKASLMDDSASFATGNNHSKVKDYLHFTMKLKNEGNKFTECFAALVRVPALTNPKSGWNDTVTKTKKNNNGFSSLRVHIDDACFVETVYGSIRTVVLKKDGTPSKKKLTYCQTDYETLNA